MLPVKSLDYQKKYKQQTIRRSHTARLFSYILRLVKGPGLVNTECMNSYALAGYAKL